MEDKTIKDPQIFISKEARKIFDEMKHYEGFFKNLDNKDLFMLAVIFGYSKHTKIPLKNQDKTESGFTRERYLSDRDNAIFKAIAMDEENNVNVINDIQRVYAIVEQYANGGIGCLRDFFHEDKASFAKKFANKLRDYLKE